MRSQIRSTAGPAIFCIIVPWLFVASTPAPAAAHALALSPDGHRLYVSVHGTAKGIDVIDAQSDALLTTLPIQFPSGDIGLHAPLALSPDGSVLYAESDLGPPTVYAINLSSGKLAATFPMVRLGDIEAIGIGDLTVSPDGSRLYTLGGDRLSSLSVVSVADTVTRKIIAALPVFGASEALTPDGKKLYVTGGYSGDIGPGVVSVIDTSTNHLIATVNVQPFPGGVAVSPGGRSVYVTHTDYNSTAVDVINAVSDKLDTPSGFLPGGAALAPVVSPDGKRLYELPLPWRMVAALDLVHGGVLGTVGVGGSPIDQVISPGGDRLYVLAQGGTGFGGLITVVDTSTFQVIGTIDLSKAPAGMP